MDDDEVIVIGSSDESDGEPTSQTRRDILQPVIQRVVDALGGYEGPAYRLGDSVGPCLSDLKKLWRKDDTDDDRTVARIFWESRVLPNDLVPILLETAGKGLVEDKKAVAAADLCCAMTWPIDLAEELKELDEEFDKGVDYTQLLQSHLAYKQALLRPGVIQSLFGIMLPPLAKTIKERTARDGQVVNVILHIFRNLAFIRDARRDIRSSADQAELGMLQGKLIKQLEETHILELLLVLAANEGNDPMFNEWNTLVLEILYLLFRGVKPAGLTTDQTKQPTENLHRLLQTEEKNRRDMARKASSRHSRFGTTISVKLNPNKKPAPAPTDDLFGDVPPEPASTPSSSQAFILHRQAALTQSSGSILDFKKKSKSTSAKRVDELGTMEEDSLGIDARGVLRRFASEVLTGCFNPFLAALLKDIKSERPKITEKDNLRLLFVTKWFLEFFLGSRSQTSEGGTWGFGLIAEVLERGWIVWVLKRMREAVDDKPKQWTELQAGIECLTQLLMLIDAMANSSQSDAEADAASTLRHQLIYNGEVLDIALDSVRSYKEGTQSLAYLDSSIYLAYALLRMLEKWGKAGEGGSGEEMYVRKKRARRRKAKKGVTEEEGVPDVEEIEPEEDDEVVVETMFTFEAFEAKFANAEITKTLLAYLERYKEFDSSENMKRIVSLIHRQAVRAKAEGLFFNVSTMNLFKCILDDQKSLPRDQPHKDLVNVVNFVLRKFFKALVEEPFLAVEAFFPKNRNQWKQFSSWEPEEKVKRERGGQAVEDTRFPPDVQVKKGYSWSEQLGIAIAALVDGGQEDLIGWVQDILTLAIAQRQRLIDEVDVKPTDDDVIEELTQPEQDDTVKQGPSNEAMSKLTDYMIPYISDEHADAATKNPQLKLVFRLVSFFILDEDADELEWYIPAAILPTELRRSLNVIGQFLETPLDLGGKKAKELLSKKTRRRRRRRSPSISGSDAEEDAPVKRKKKEKKIKEKEIYKSAQFIEDSDEEYGDMDAFLQREKALREKTSKSATEGGKIGTMKATGTKKRRRGKDGKGTGRKKRRGEPDSTVDQENENKSDTEDSDIGVIGELEADEPAVEASATKPRPRPKPRPQQRKISPNNSSPPNNPDAAGPPISSDVEDDPPRTVSPTNEQPPSLAGKKKGRIIISDDED